MRSSTADSSWTFLSAEHLKANDSLVTLLKNGTGKVYKSDLKNRYPLSKEFLFKFTQEHPEVLQAYKETLPEKAKPIEALEIEFRQQVPRPATSDPDTTLEQIPPDGNARESTTQRFSAC